MKKFCVVLTLLAILVVGFSFYQGWFTLSRQATEAGSNKVNINLTADPDKMKQDFQAVNVKSTD